MKEIQTQIAGKKKEQALVQLLEKLFNCLVDTDKWTYLSERTSFTHGFSAEDTKSHERTIRFDSYVFALPCPLTPSFVSTLQFSDMIARRSRDMPTTSSTLDTESLKVH